MAKTINDDTYWASNRTTRNSELDDFVWGKDIKTSGGKKGLRRLCATQNLQEDGSCRWDEGSTIDGERAARESKRDSKVNGNICTTS